MKQIILGYRDFDKECYQEIANMVGSSITDVYELFISVAFMESRFLYQLRGHISDSLKIN